MKMLKSLLAEILKRLLPPERNEKKIISAVHEEDIEDVLEKLGLLHSLKKGEIRCESCNAIITTNNLQSFFAINGKIGFCCENLMCYETLIEKMGVNRNGLLRIR